ncbi:hypothetical protein [Shewanella sp. GXUN23E]|uniref:hypothetical protein n=1 Tax=Shewanella sp. GXUN23E TaxID=3422498 RepID=UPI003D7EEFFC
MKIMEKQLADVLTDVLCDVCGSSTTGHSGCGPDYASLTADWGYGSAHDGDSYEIHLCERCFFNTLENLKVRRSDAGLFGNDNQPSADEFALKRRRL